MKTNRLGLARIGTIVARSGAMTDPGEPVPARDESGLPPRVLSGLQSSGDLHLGNYFGAVRQHIELQDDRASASTSSPTTTR